MNEQTKAAIRRIRDWAFPNLYFVGEGLDVGAGADPLDPLVYPRITSVTAWDKPQGDASTLPGLHPGSFDFLHASHCIEHLPHPGAALARWIEVVRPGGHLILTVPDWEMYEGCRWPSRYSNEHAWAFSLDPSFAVEPHVRYVPTFLDRHGHGTTVERICAIRQHWDPNGRSDQTLGAAECAIEIVLKKRTA